MTWLIAWSAYTAHMQHTTRLQDSGKTCATRQCYPRRRPIKTLHIIAGADDIRFRMRMYSMALRSKLNSRVQYTCRILILRSIPASNRCTFRHLWHRVNRSSRDMCASILSHGYDRATLRHYSITFAAVCGRRVSSFCSSFSYYFYVSSCSFCFVIPIIIFLSCFSFTFSFYYVLMDRDMMIDKSLSRIAFEVIPGR